ncbi:MAG: type II secretion system protein [Pyrinomonadaceae bacterium]
MKRSNQLATIITRCGERGASLVALMAFMSLLAILAMAVAPSIHQQAQRQKEEEAIFRGEEVAQAIRQYMIITGRLPTSMDQLTDGLAVPGRTTKLQILRPVAAIDPLSSKGVWKLVKSRSQEIVDFHRRVMSYNNGRLPDTRDQNLPVFSQELVPLASVVIDEEGDAEDKAPGDEDASDNSSGPFIGVVSRARKNSVITYYGIGRYDRWIFTPLFR